VRYGGRKEGKWYGGREKIASGPKRSERVLFQIKSSAQTSGMTTKKGRKRAQILGEERGKRHPPRTRAGWGPEGQRNQREEDGSRPAVSGLRLCDFSRTQHSPRRRGEGERAER